MKRFLALIICCVLMTGLLTGCGSTDTSGQNPGEAHEQNAADDSTVENEQFINDEESAVEEND